MIYYYSYFGWFYCAIHMPFEPLSIVEDGVLFISYHWILIEVLGGNNVLSDLI